MAQVIKPVYGVTRVAYAIRKVAEDGTITFEKPVLMQGPKRVGVSTTINSNPYYEGSKLAFTEHIATQKTIALDMTMLTDVDIALLCGYTLAEQGGYYKPAFPVGQNVAFMIELRRADCEEFDYVTYYDGVFTESDQEWSSAEGQGTNTVKSLTSSFKVDDKSEWKVSTDSDGAAENLHDTFFDAVVIPSEKTVVAE